MAQDKNEFEAMMNLWQEGQETFLKAQKEITESFQNSFIGHPYTSEENNSSDPLTQWQGLIKSWAPNWNPYDMMKGANVFTSNNNGFDTLLNPLNWTKYAPEQLRTVLESIADGPQFSDLATPQIDAVESWSETMDYQKAASDFAKLLNGAWEKTYAAFSLNYSLEDLKSTNMKEALDAWLKAANFELQEIQRTAPFMDAQQRMLRAAMEIKARQRDIAEVWSEAYQMPTRSEIDDLTKIVHELRRELRKVKRELDTLKSSGQS